MLTGSSSHIIWIWSQKDGSNIGHPPCHTQWVSRHDQSPHLWHNRHRCHSSTFPTLRHLGRKHEIQIDTAIYSMYSIAGTGHCPSLRARILSSFIIHSANSHVNEHVETKWVWINTYRYIFSGMNIHLPAILGFTRYQGFDPSPNMMINWNHEKGVSTTTTKLRSAPTDTATGPFVTRASILGVEKLKTPIAQEEVAWLWIQLQGSRDGTCSLEVFPSLITTKDDNSENNTNPHRHFLCIVMLARSFLRSVGV